MRNLIVFLSIILLTSLIVGCNNEVKIEENSKHKSATKSAQKSLNEIYDITPESPFSFEVGSKFNVTISKTDLMQARSIFDIAPKEGAEDIVAIRDIEIEKLNATIKVVQRAKTDKLDAEQIALLQTYNYGDNFCIAALSTHKFKDELEERCFVNYLTVVPEKQAEYIGGKTQLMKYIGEQIYEDIKDVEKRKLKPGKIQFQIDKNGQLNSAILESTCGYKQIDQKVLKVLNNLPNNWKAAQDESGQAITQELYMSFGIWGC